MEVGGSRGRPPPLGVSSTILAKECMVLLHRASACWCCLSFVIFLTKTSRVKDLFLLPVLKFCSTVIQPIPQPKKWLVIFLIQTATASSWYVARDTNVWKQIKHDNLLLDQVRPFTLYQEKMHQEMYANIWQVKGFLLLYILSISFRVCFPNKGMQLVTSYLFQKVYVCYQFKNIRSHTHVAYPTLKLGQKETFGFVVKVRKYQYWWVSLREPLKNYTSNAGTLWHFQYIYMLWPADISNEKGLMTLFVPENVMFAKCFTWYKKWVVLTIPGPIPTR